MAVCDTLLLGAAPAVRIQCRATLPKRTRDTFGDVRHTSLSFCVLSMSASFVQHATVRCFTDTPRSPQHSDYEVEHQFHSVYSFCSGDLGRRNPRDEFNLF